MQNFTAIAGSDSIGNSLDELLNNTRTALTLSSGTSSPTTENLIGRPYFNTSDNKIYLYQAITTTNDQNQEVTTNQYKEMLNLSKTLQYVEDLDLSSYSKTTHKHDDDYARLDSANTFAQAATFKESVTFEKAVLQSQPAATASDRRLKENIEMVKSSLDLLEGLYPHRYKYKGQNEMTVGLIAQDVQGKLPEAVTVIPNKPMGIDRSENTLFLNYVGLVAVAIGGINELKERIENIEKSLAQ